jgi:hypothetical protein
LRSPKVLTNVSTCAIIEDKGRGKMISTVTTTVSTIVSSSAAVGLLASLGVAGVLTLVGSLVMKELATSEGFRQRLFKRNLDIIVLPLFFAFSFIVFMKVWEIFS